jgi:hypothetical protein
MPPGLPIAANASEPKLGFSFMSNNTTSLTSNQLQLIPQKSQNLQQRALLSNGETYSVQASEKYASNPMTRTQRPSSNLSLQPFSVYSENNPVSFEQRPLTITTIGQKSNQSEMYHPTTTTCFQSQPIVTQTSQPTIAHYHQPVITERVVEQIR